jgi:hypothetical protein
MRIVGIVAILLVAVPASATAQGQPAGPIVWQLQNPFRHFKQAAHTEEHRQAFLALTEPEKAEPILSVQRRLAAKNPQQGWAAAVFEHVVDEACWYTHTGGKAPCGEYIKPKTHAIWLSAPTISGACSWHVAGQTIPAPDCRVPKAATVPGGAKTEVTLSTPSQPVVAKDTIEVDDVLVVGLGDSFASGDGNPDRPVSFKRRRALDYDNATLGYPRREPPERAAGWVHRTCHRSLYSYQLRVALQLAVEDPDLHRSVTFVGLGCTGATILDLFEQHTGRDEPPSNDDKPHSSRKLGLSQLSMLSHVLCQPNEAELDKAVDYNADERVKLPQKGKHQTINIYGCAADKRLRNVDLLLLSIGGNDVGFSGLVANASLKKEELVLPALFGEDPRIDPDIARTYLKRFPGRFQALGEALAAVMGPDSPGRVILGTYPRMGFNQDGEPCGSGNRGFDVTNIWGLNGKVIAETETFVESDLMPAMAKAAQDARWNLADAVRTEGKFRKQGICASGEQEATEAAWHNGRFPRYRYSGTVGWAPFKPDQFMPYKTRQRWFRTPNDAFMTAHYSDRTKLLPELRITGWSAYSGAFHPTAEGQAAIADATMKLAREILARRPRPSQ